MNSNNFWKFLSGLGIAFALPWLFLIVIPFIGYSDVTPVAYGETEEVMVVSRSIRIARFSVTALATSVVRSTRRRVALTAIPR